MRFVSTERPDWFGWYREYQDPTTGEKDRWFIQVNLTRHTTIPPRNTPGGVRTLSPYEVRIVQET